VCYSMSVAISTFLVCLLSSSSLVSCADGPQRSTKESIIKGTPRSWKEGIIANVQERDEIAKGLFTVGLNKSLRGDDRIEAIVLLAQIQTPEVIDFLVKNVSLHVDKTIILSGEDRSKEHPCAHALIEMGWIVIPKVISVLGEKTSDEELGLFSRILGKIASKAVAISILTAKKSDGSPVLIQNIEKVIALLNRKE